MLKGPVAVGALRTSFVLGVRLVIQAGTLLLVARVLGPDQFGAFAGIAAFALLLGAISTFGTHMVLFREISEQRACYSDVLSYAIPTTMLAGSCVLLIFSILTAWLLNYDFPSKVWFAIGMTEILLQPLFLLMVAEYHAAGQIARSQLLQNVPLTFRFLTALGILFFELQPAIDIYVIGYLFSSALALLIGLYFLPGKWPAIKCWRLPSLSEIYIACGCAASNVSKSAPTEFDKTLAIKLLPMELAGVYAAGARVVGAISVPVIAMTQSALPRLFRESSRLFEERKRLISWMYFMSLAYSLLLAIPLWLFAPTLGGLFGGAYEGIHEVIRWLCLGIPAMSLRLVAVNILLASGSPWVRVNLEFGGVFVLAVSGIVLVQILGIVGMVLAVVFAEWVMALSASYCVWSLKSK